MEKIPFNHVPLPEPVPITEQVWPEGTEPLVCTQTMAYMHEKFIRQCIEGILMQRTTFPVQVVIHDDASTDATPEIIREYETKYPQLIKVVYQRENSYSKPDRAVRRAELKRLSREGRYNALCEGDDYWIDPLKLQKQVEALEADPKAVACFTNAYNEKAGVRTEYMDGSYTKIPGRIVQQSELVNAQGLPTCTFFFRRSVVPPLPKHFSKAPTGDTLFYTFASNFGYFIYLPIFTGVRQMHAGGMHSLTSSSHRYMTTLLNLPFLDEASHFRHHALIKERRRRMGKTGWILAQQEGHVELAKACWRIMAGMRKEVGWGLPTTIRNYLKVFWPRTEAWAGGLWDRIRGRRGAPDQDRPTAS